MKQGRPQGRAQAHTITCGITNGDGHGAHNCLWTSQHKDMHTKQGRPQGRAQNTPNHTWHHQSPIAMDTEPTTAVDLGGLTTQGLGTIQSPVA